MHRRPRGRVGSRDTAATAAIFGNTFQSCFLGTGQKVPKSREDRDLDDAQTPQPTPPPRLKGSYP